MRTLPIQTLSNLTGDELVTYMESTSDASNNSVLDVLITHVNAVSNERQVEIDDLADEIDELTNDVREADEKLDDIECMLNSLSDKVSQFLNNPQFNVENATYGSNGELLSVCLYPDNLSQPNMRDVHIDIHYNEYSENMDCTIFTESSSHGTTYSLHSRTIKNLKLEILPYFIHEIYSWGVGDIRHV